MKKFVTLLATVSAVAFLAACSEQEDKPMTMPTTSSSSSETTQTSTVAQEAPDFTLQSMDGKTVRLSDYKGKKVYLKFWASWCGPCKKSMPELVELAGKTDRDFEIFNMGVGLMLAVSPENVGRVKDLLDEPVYEIGRIVKKENESVIIKLKK